MFLKGVFVLCVFFPKNVVLAHSDHYDISKVLVVSTKEDSSNCGCQNDDCIDEIQDVITALNTTITNYFQKAKQEIIDQTENKLAEKLSKIKEEIIDSVEAITVKIPRDCSEIQKKGYKDSGVYRIQPYSANNEISVFCDMTTRGGGWTYVINRLDGSQNFYLNWTDYKNGFGNPAGEYWLGLEHQYHLTSSKPNELLIELVDWDLKKVYAHYNKFQIGSDFEGYKFKALGEYTGDAGDSLRGVHFGNKFSTLDRDQDTYSGNCASAYRGAWWYGACFESHLTGRYVKDANPVPFATGIHWKPFHGLYYSLKEARMMIRPLKN